MKKKKETEKQKISEKIYKMLDEYVSKKIEPIRYNTGIYEVWSEEGNLGIDYTGDYEETKRHLIGQCLKILNGMKLLKEIGFRVLCIKEGVIAGIMFDFQDL